MFLECFDNIYSSWLIQIKVIEDTSKDIRTLLRPTLKEVVCVSAAKKLSSIMWLNTYWPIISINMSMYIRQKFVFEFTDLLSKWSISIARFILLIKYKFLFFLSNCGLSSLTKICQLYEQYPSIQPYLPNKIRILYQGNAHFSITYSKWLVKNARHVMCWFI